MQQRNILYDLGRYKFYWCPGFLCCWAINRYDLTHKVTPVSGDCFKLISAATTFASRIKTIWQGIYRSGEMYWMTFPWSWPKVTAVASISKNLLVCMIKWELLIWSLQNMVDLLTYHDYYLIRFWGKTVRNCYFCKFSIKKMDVFYQGHTILAISQDLVQLILETLQCIS